MTPRKVSYEEEPRLTQPGYHLSRYVHISLHSKMELLMENFAHVNAHLFPFPPHPRPCNLAAKRELGLGRLCRSLSLLDVQNNVKLSEISQTSFTLS